MKVIFWRDRRLWCVTIPHGWKENLVASVCFLQCGTSKLHRLTTTTDYHKHQPQTHIAIKRNEKHLNRIITQESIFSPPALVATCGFCAGFDTCEGISRWSDCTHTTSQRNVNNSDPQALRLSRKKTGHMDQEKNCLVLQSRAPNWTSGGPKYFIPLKLYPNIT